MKLYELIQELEKLEQQGKRDYEITDGVEITIIDKSKEIIIR